MSVSKVLRPAAAGKCLRGIWLAAIFIAAGFCQRAAAQQFTAQDYEGTFGGTYRANQGVTRVVLVLEAINDGEVGARYVFYPDHTNPNVPSGEFLLQGTVDSKTGRLVLVGKQWIDQPKGFVMVDVACLLSADRQSLTGQVYLHEDKNVKFDLRAARWSRLR